MSFYSPFYTYIYLSTIHLTSSNDVESFVGFLFIYGSVVILLLCLDCLYDI